MRSRHEQGRGNGVRDTALGQRSRERQAQVGLPNQVRQTRKSGSHPPQSIFVHSDSTCPHYTIDLKPCSGVLQDVAGSSCSQHLLDRSVNVRTCSDPLAPAAMAVFELLLGQRSKPAGGAMW